MTNQILTPLMATPWGVRDSLTQHAEGIYSVTTPSHGGFWLSPERLAQVPPSWRLARFGHASSLTSPWFEEDCDAWLVVLAFPDLWAQERVDMARLMKPRIFKRLAPVVSVYFIRYDAPSANPFRPTPAEITQAWRAGHYVLTARVTADDLEDAWRLTNNVDTSWSRAGIAGVEVVAPLPTGRDGQTFGHRSAMVGDVFIIDGAPHYVAPVGFAPVRLNAGVML